MCVYVCLWGGCDYVAICYCSPISILTPVQRKLCEEAIRGKGFKVIDAALKSINSANATATEVADLKAIQTLILAHHGNEVTSYNLEK